MAAPWTETPTPEESDADPFGSDEGSPERGGEHDLRRLLESTPSEEPALRNFQRAGLGEPGVRPPSAACCFRGARSA
eukprot:7739152-Alexandrium_andersonii.AAC.1